MNDEEQLSGMTFDPSAGLQENFPQEMPPARSGDHLRIRSEKKNGYYFIIDPGDKGGGKKGGKKSGNKGGKKGGKDKGGSGAVERNSSSSRGSKTPSNFSNKGATTKRSSRNRSR